MGSKKDLMKLLRLDTIDRLNKLFRVVNSDDLDGRLHFTRKQMIILYELQNKLRDKDEPINFAELDKLKNKLISLETLIVATNSLTGKMYYRRKIDDLHAELDEQQDKLKRLSELHKRSLFGGSSQTRIELPPGCLLYTSPSPRDKRQSRMPSSA